MNITEFEKSGFDIWLSETYEGYEARPLINSWEVMRFVMPTGITHVIYKNAKGKVTMDDDVKELYKRYQKEQPSGIH